MRTSPAPGFGISRSTISKSPPGFEICATFIGAIPTFVVAIISPLNFQQIFISLCDRSVSYLPSSTLDSRRDRSVTNYFLNAWVLRTDSLFCSHLNGQLRTRWASSFSPADCFGKLKLVKRGEQNGVNHRYGFDSRVRLTLRLSGPWHHLLSARGKSTQPWR